MAENKMDWIIKVTLNDIIGKSAMENWGVTSFDDPLFEKGNIAHNRFIQFTKSLRAEMDRRLDGLMELHNHNSVPGYFDGLDEGCNTCVRNAGIKECREALSKEK